ncbi:NlpC/P60 family protein, partial [Nocardia elegans]|nr:NlpC/P60 family protein [Nocardia elegans]
MPVSRIDGSTGGCVRMTRRIEYRKPLRRIAFGFVIATVASVLLAGAGWADTGSASG